MKRKILLCIIIIGILSLILLGFRRKALADEFDSEYLFLTTSDFPNEGFGIDTLVWNTENEITIHGLADDWLTVPMAVFSTTSGTIKKIDNYSGLSPVISPNQEYLAFSTTHIKIVKNEYPYEVLHTVDGTSLAITWNAESNMIYWITLSNDIDGNVGIQVHSYNLDSRIQEHLFDYTENNITYGNGISLSPDGKNLVFSISKTRTSEKYFLSSDIVLVNIESGEMQKITNSLEIDERYPEWFSNDIITYRECDMRSRCRHYYLGFHDLETNCSRIVHNADNYKNPSWSADRSQLAYLSAERFIYIIPVEDILPVESAHEWICEK